MKRLLLPLLAALALPTAVSAEVNDEKFVMGECMAGWESAFKNKQSSSEGIGRKEAQIICSCFIKELKLNKSAYNPMQICSDRHLGEGVVNFNKEFTATFFKSKKG